MIGLKRAVKRGVQSFAYGTTINLILGVIIICAVGKPGFVPVIPDYAKRFSSDTVAFAVQCILVGVTSMAFGGGSEILEIARWSLLKQSVIYFLVTAAVWMPVSIFCWGFGKYVSTFVSVTISYLIGYVISWTVRYRICKKNVAEINRKLEELNAGPEK